MLVIVVALFAFCWLPLQTYGLLSQITEEVNKYKYINIIWFCSNWLAMSNSCYNPFIYGLLNEKFKHCFRLLFIRCPCIRKDLMKQKFHEHSEESVRKSKTTAAVNHHHLLQHHHHHQPHQQQYHYPQRHLCPEDKQYLQVNGGRNKRYVRVSGTELTEQSYL